MAKPKGSPKTGGRQKGSKNKINRQREIQNAAAAKGMLPLNFMLQVMRDPKQNIALRCDMAKSAAPYLHAKRAPEDKGGNTVPPVIYMTPNLEDD
jgi:hypothetical protein